MKITLARIEKNIERIPESGCWIWMGTTNGFGYGRLNSDRKRKYAHRAAYELLIGEIPAGMQIDHLCRVKSCCNPAHLEPVTSLENTMRGDGPRLTRERSATVTHCPKGHEYTPANTRFDRNGSRCCRECAKLRERARRRTAKGDHHGMD